jgi:hypothetical protein
LVALGHFKGPLDTSVMFHWPEVVFDISDTCHRSLILTQYFYLHLHYASPLPSCGLSTRTDDRCKQAERVTQDNIFVIPFVEATCSVWSGEQLISVKLVTEVSAGSSPRLAEVRRFFNIAHETRTGAGWPLTRPNGYILFI